MFRYLILSFFLCLQCWAHDPLNEGIHLFYEKEYDSAMQIFERADANQTQPIGALIGQLLCQVALGRLDEIDATIISVKEKIEFQPQCTMPTEDRVLTLEEHHAAYFCRRKVREVANQMRQTVENLVRETVPGFIQKIKMLRKLYPFIDSLEYAGIDCCEHNLATACCLNPLFQQLELWNSLGLQEKE